MCCFSLHAAIAQTKISRPLAASFFIPFIIDHKVLTINRAQRNHNGPMLIYASSPEKELDPDNMDFNAVGQAFRSNKKFPKKMKEGELPQMVMCGT